MLNRLPTTGRRLGPGGYGKRFLPEYHANMVQLNKIVKTLKGITSDRVGMDMTSVRRGITSTVALEGCDASTLITTSLTPKNIRRSDLTCSERETGIYTSTLFPGLRIPHSQQHRCISKKNSRNLNGIVGGFNPRTLAENASDELNVCTMYSTESDTHARHNSALVMEERHRCIHTWVQPNSARAPSDFVPTVS